MSRLLVLLALITVTAACAPPGPARPDAAVRAAALSIRHRRI
jgi:hypothetical protein